MKLNAQNLSGAYHKKTSHKQHTQPTIQALLNIKSSANFLDHAYTLIKSRVERRLSKVAIERAKNHNANKNGNLWAARKSKLITLAIELSNHYPCIPHILTGSHIWDIALPCNIPEQAWNVISFKTWKRREKWAQYTAWNWNIAFFTLHITRRSSQNQQKKIYLYKKKNRWQYRPNNRALKMQASTRQRHHVSKSYSKPITWLILVDLLCWALRKLTLEVME